MHWTPTVSSSGARLNASPRLRSSSSVSPTPDTSLASSRRTPQTFSSTPGSSTAWLQESLFEPRARSYAGPGNAYTWFHYTAPDEALFIYKLPYTETSRYLRRILTHYYHYTRLYPR